MENFEKISVEQAIADQRDLSLSKIYDNLGDCDGDFDILDSFCDEGDSIKEMAGSSLSDAFSAEADSASDIAYFSQTDEYRRTHEFTMEWAFERGADEWGDEFTSGKDQRGNNKGFEQFMFDLTRKVCFTAEYAKLRESAAPLLCEKALHEIKKEGLQEIYSNQLKTLQKASEQSVLDDDTQALADAMTAVLKHDHSINYSPDHVKGLGRH